jgi:hypothetical protein
MEKYIGNIQGRDAWARFAPHRAQVMRLLEGGRGTLAVLGAGNLNDVDLGALQRSYDEIHAIDVDGESVRLGVRRQHARIDVHAPVDLTAPLPPLGPFDVVLSAGVLTQMILAGDTLALRDKHLGDLVALSRGRIVLVTDVVSSTTAPSVLRATDLEAEMAALVGARNFFTGANPYRLAALLEADQRVCDVELHDPWLWRVTADREHLTCAITARRR